MQADPPLDRFSSETRQTRSLKVGGFVPFTATDYPGQLAAVVFVQGCPWRCDYCHNPHLQARPRHGAEQWQTILKRLTKRVGLIDAVVFSGGEPTMDPELPSAIRHVKELGFKVGLHSAGTYPRQLMKILPLLDWIGLDIKASLESYPSITSVSDSGRRAFQSLESVLASGVSYECRTTLHPAILPEPEVLRLAQCLAGMGVQNYVLQVFRKDGCIHDALNSTSLAGYPSEDLVAQVRTLFPKFDLRRD